MKKLDGVMETLLITLAAKVDDAGSDSPVVNDKAAVALAGKIDYDFSKFYGGMRNIGIIARVKVMDDEIKKFIAQYPDCVVVSVGSGLDTRFSRVDNGKILWYDIDFPEVIELRNELIEQHERVKNIDKSALDSSWTVDIEIGNRKLLIIAEGFMMFLKGDEVKNFLEILTNGFDEFTAHFDLIHKVMVGKANKHPSLKHTSANFHFGVKDGSELVALCPKLERIDCINLTGFMQTLMKGIQRIFIPIFKVVNNRIGIYHYKK